MLYEAASDDPDLHVAIFVISGYFSGTCTTTHLAFRVIAITGLETILKHKKFLDESLDLNEQDHRVRMYDLVYRYECHIATGHH